MRSIILALILLAGCSSRAPEPVPAPVVPKDNPKDAYVDRLEKEAGEGAAALVAARPHLEGKGKPLVELTETRLSGIQQPTAANVEKYRKAIDSQKALDEEKAKAKKVDEETTKLANRIAQMDRENAELRTSIEAMKKEERWKDVQEAFLKMAVFFGVVGAAFLAANALIGKGLRSGVVMFLLSGVSAATPFVLRDLIESPWFKYTALAVVVGGMAFAFWSAISTHKEVKSRLRTEGGS